MTPIALTIAGSDSSAGAGLQADLKTFSALRVYGLTAVTCIVAETPKIVSSISPVDPVILQEQITLLLESYPVAAIKTGMLYSTAHLNAVCEILEQTDIPLIVDPVMVASTGTSLLQDEALHATRDRLCPLATVITPNLPEASALLDRETTRAEQQEEAALEICQRYSAACYLKGGHLEHVTEHRDILATTDGIEEFSAPHLDLPQTHGTGCTLASALAAGLAHQKTISAAAREAHHFTHQALLHSHTWGNLSHLDQVQQHSLR